MFLSNALYKMSTRHTLSLSLSEQNFNSRAQNRHYRILNLSCFDLLHMKKGCSIRVMCNNFFCIKNERKNVRILYQFFFSFLADPIRFSQRTKSFLKFIFKIILKAKYLLTYAIHAPFCTYSLLLLSFISSLVLTFCTIYFSALQANFTQLAVSPPYYVSFPMILYQRRVRKSTIHSHRLSPPPRIRPHTLTKCSCRRHRDIDQLSIAIINIRLWVLAVWAVPVVVVA